jgi:hypothetical protein
MVIHAMAKGVHTQDLMTFCRCDYLTILRVNPAVQFNGTPIDAVADVQAARLSALQKIGDSYDFDASDTARFNRFSCSELVYYCLRSIHGALQVKPLPHALFRFAPLNKSFSVLKRVTIVPDDFYSLTRTGTMLRIWEDAISTRMHGDRRDTRYKKAAGETAG